MKKRVLTLLSEGIIHLPSLASPLIDKVVRDRYSNRIKGWDALVGFTSFVLFDEEKRITS